MTFGLTADGFVPMTLQDVRDAINTRIYSTISSTLDLSNRSLEGQIIGIVSEALTKLWEVAEVVNSSLDPDKAFGAALDALCLLTGTFRVGASASTVNAFFTGTPTTLIPAGTGVRVPGETRFETNADATIGAATAWVGSSAYIIGNIVTNSGQVYIANNAGTSAASPGPSHTVRSTLSNPVVITPDGSVNWIWLGTGTGYIETAATATVTGVTIANAFTLTEIMTPIGGVSSVVNQLDAKVGRDQMSDSELRIFRQIEIAQPGTSPADAIRAAVLALADVAAVTVFVNNTDSTNGDGVPPHSIETLVRGGADQDIWDTLLANVAAGIATYGSEDGFATDSQGIDHAMSFSRPGEINIYIAATVVKDPLTYPADGDDQIKAAMVAYGNAQDTGKDAVASRLAAAAFTVQGVLDVTSVFIKTSPGPTLSTTIPISLRQLAVYDTSRIAVTSSNGTP